jgi:hypothetical protein
LKAPRRLHFVSLALTLATLSSAQPPQTQPSDDAAIITLITNYYTAYSKKELRTMVLFWSQRSPEFRAGIEEALHTIESGVYDSSAVSVSQIRISDNKATLQASANFASSDAQTGLKHQQRRIRNFAVIKEGREWKIWRDADSSQDLSAFLEKGSEWKASADSIEQFAVALVNASDPERERLLADNKKMVTTELRDALVRKVGPLECSRQL